MNVESKTLAFLIYSTVQLTQTSGSIQNPKSTLHQWTHSCRWSDRLAHSFTPITKKHKPKKRFTARLDCSKSFHTLWIQNLNLFIMAVRGTRGQRNSIRSLEVVQPGNQGLRSKGVRRRTHLPIILYTLVGGVRDTGKWPRHRAQGQGWKEK